MAMDDHKPTIGYGWDISKKTHYPPLRLNLAKNASFRFTTRKKMSKIRTWTYKFYEWLHEHWAGRYTLILILKIWFSELSDTVLKEFG